MIRDDEEIPDVKENQRRNKFEVKEETSSERVKRYLGIVVFFLTNGFTIGATIITSVTWWYFKKFCSPTEINVAELRFYIVVFLVLCLFMLLAVMRMYNAIVANTAYLLKFKESIKTITKEINRLHGNMKDDSRAFSRLAKEFSDAMKSFINLIKNS